MANVLIVEDNDVLNRAYKIMLEKNGHTVASVFNGQEALDKLKDFEPDVILLDLMMPVMDGLAFLKKYDAKQNDGVKVVVLTNLGQDKEIKEAMDLGAYKYILKAHAGPMDLSMLVDKISGSSKKVQS